jgi:hypothetical protein
VWQDWNTGFIRSIGCRGKGDTIIKVYIIFGNLVRVGIQRESQNLDG